MVEVDVREAIRELQPGDGVRAAPGITVGRCRLGIGVDEPGDFDVGGAYAVTRFFEAGSTILWRDGTWHDTTGYDDDRRDPLGWYRTADDVIDVLYPALIELGLA